MRDRHNRNIMAFGSDGQQRISELKIAVVGFGGLGTHVVQQLCYLGVGELSIVDAENLEESNLNRYVGTLPEDVGDPKTEIAKRIVSKIDPKIKVHTAQKSLISREAFNLVKQSDYVFGCLDHDGPRHVLNELTLAYKLQYFDLASEIILLGNTTIFGGRVCFINGTNGCLYCLGLIDKNEVASFMQNPLAREDTKNLYGMDQDDLNISGPSIVSVNGVIASLAVTEFIANATGMRPANSCLVYRGDHGRVTVNLDKGDSECYYCNNIRGLKAKADFAKYLL